MMALYEINCQSEAIGIYLTNYADLMITDKDKNIVGVRFGGYPEQVTAMTDAIASGCNITVNSEKGHTDFTSKNHCNFSRKTVSDGIYTESVMFLKDSDVRVVNPVEKNEKCEKCKKQEPPRTMYIYCRTDSRDELFGDGVEAVRGNGHRGRNFRRRTRRNVRV
jgi:hypothetical protein